MSIEVALHELAETLAKYRFAYLLTVRDGDRAHVVAVTPTLTGERLLVPEPGRTTRANLETRPSATLVWPPADPGDYTLIVDGAAEQRDGQVTVAPTRAVLHRPAPGHAGSPTGCGSDCVELPVVPETAS
ncbi:hypothetical protein [Pseudonocardia asaccharolytica]|uniref:Pyridoxamine 5'-phosphate oxidase putative domain-containing protein n=1 Tax=Pseudonocardia asaccharolytica DSM 44247 = NBRC 16224 TaxID=1123024 RepID=A0A511D4H5_9PSEU|nr:hypothetical protein [Pseudonocardia asaccharolytica]GEL19671.1 hypothetical protein PA7_35080 [Pseudonocardia asaccharolytica DSM 44247 = NBRC 16224]